MSRIFAFSSVLGLLAGCSDYGLHGEQDPAPDAEDPIEDPVDDPTDDPVDDPEDDPEDTGDPVDEDPPPDVDELIDCESVGLWTDQWWGSMPFDAEADPTDGAGRTFYDPAFTMVDFSTVAIPDEGHVPSGMDRVYRTTLWLDATGPKVFLDLQTDDGVWVWLDGEYLGHWGGEWQEEGCVNDDASCTEFVFTDPVEITDQVEAGGNVLAVRLSNAIDNAYMGIRARCEE